MRLTNKLVVEGDGDSFPGADEPKHALVADVPVLTQQQPLDAQLHPFRFPRAMGVVWRRPSFGVDRDHRATGALQHVDLGDQPEHVRGELQRSGYLDLALARQGRSPALGVDRPVLPTAIDGVEVVGELRVDPLEEEQAGAVRELVYHPGWDEVGDDRPFVGADVGCGHGLPTTPDVSISTAGAPNEP